jgi:hypothetical protein
VARPRPDRLSPDDQPSLLVLQLNRALNAHTRLNWSYTSSVVDKSISVSLIVWVQKNLFQIKRGHTNVGGVTSEVLCYCSSTVVVVLLISSIGLQMWPLSNWFYGTCKMLETCSSVHFCIVLVTITLLLRNSPRSWLFTVLLCWIAESGCTV